VKKIIKDKRLLYRECQKKGGVRIKELYLTKKKEAKWAVAEATENEGKKTIEQLICNSRNSSNVCM